MCQLNDMYVKKSQIGTLAGFILILILLMSGCSNGPSCAINEKVVDGKCVVVRCDTDKTSCPSGTYCDQGQTCVIHPRVACQKDSECGTGTCVEGACVSPQWCRFNADCMPGDACDTKTSQCYLSACKDGCHAGGVCDESAGVCVSAATCTLSTETVDCVQGEKCVEQSNHDFKCMNGADYCNTNPCQRGQCNPKTFTCVRAQDCYGNDQLCMLGEYCDQHTCKKNKCISDKSGCTGGRGVCNRSSGVCENKTGCVADQECLSGYKCIFSEPSTTPGRVGKCLQESATGDYCEGACTGGQVCTEENDAWNCKEPDTCVNALDCLGERGCVFIAKDGKNKCHTSASCMEPHKGDSNTPVAFSGEAKNVILCNGSDYYTYQLSSVDPDALVMVQLTIDSKDIGVGDVKLSLSSSDNSFVHKTVTLPKDGSKGNTLVETFKPSNDVKASYLFQVEGVEGASQSIHYTLTAKVIPKAIAQSCGNVKEVTIGKTMQSRFERNANTALKGCGDTLGEYPEEVWHFSLSKEQSVNVSIFGGPALDASVSLHKTCDGFGTSMECANDYPSGHLEGFSKVLPAGDYYLVTQSLDIGVHDYSLLVEVSDPACDLSQVTCQSKQMTYCPFSREGLKTVTCQQDCTSEPNGHCGELDGSSCVFAHAVTKDTPFSSTVTLSKVKTNNLLSLSSDCGTVSPKYTAFSEKVYAVTVPKGYGIDATASSTDYDSRFVFYMLDQCDGSADHCVAGVGKNDSINTAQHFQWVNTESMDKLVYLVLDGGGESVSTSLEAAANVSIEVKKMECLQGSYHCSGDDLEKCSSDGLTWEKYITCEPGQCAPSALGAHCAIPEGDTCQNPIELTPTTPAKDYNIHFGSDDYPTPTSCGGVFSRYFQGDEEYVFKVHADYAGDVIKTTVTPNSSASLILWVADQCSPHLADQCKDGVSKWNLPETLTVVADADNKDYYFVVQGKETSPTTKDGSFRIETSITSRASECIKQDGSKTIDVGKIIPCQSNSIFYCDKTGHLVRYPCSSCTDGSSACDDPAGGYCEDAVPIDLSKSPSDHRSLDLYKFPGDNFSSPVNGASGQCVFESGASYSGKDLVYAIKIPAHKKLKISLKANYATKETNVVRGYFLKDCHDMNSCVGSIYSGDSKLTYTTGDNEETIFYVIDTTGEMDSNSWVRIDWDTLDADPNVHTLSCQPGSLTCETTGLSYCDANGHLIDSTCPSTTTCKNGACEISDSHSEGESCDKPFDISSLSLDPPVSFHWNTKPLTKEADNKCVASTGKVRYFKVHANKGDTIVVEAGAVNGEFLKIGYYNFAYAGKYILSDCSLEQTGCSAMSYSNAPLTYRAERTGDYYIAIADPQKGSDTEMYARLSKLPACSDSPKCATDSLTGDSYVSYCNNGAALRYTCKSSCNTSHTACSDDEGRFCFDAHPLSDSGSLTSESLYSEYPPVWLEYNRLKNIGGNDQTDFSGNCMFYHYPGGDAKYYSVDLKKGDLLHVSLSNFSNRNLSLYLLDDCQSQQCVTNDPQMRVMGARELNYVAPQDKTYYIVVSDGERTSGTQFDIAWNITRNSTTEAAGALKSAPKKPGLCQPFTSQCFDDGGTMKVHTCSAAGDSIDIAACPTGTTCSEGVCQIDQYINSNTSTGINSCIDGHTVEVSHSQRFDIRPRMLTPTHQGKIECETMLSPAADDTLGTDAFFKVTIPKGKYLNVWVRGLGTDMGEKDRIAYYTYDSCDLTQSCDIGGSYLINHPGVYEKIATFEGDMTKDKTFFLGLGGFKEDVFLTRSIFFDFFEPACSIKGSTVCDSSGKDLLYCVYGGSYEHYTCSSKQCDKSLNECSTPTGDNCLEAIPVDYTIGKEWKPTVHNFANATNALSTEKNSEQRCSGDMSDGKDLVYKIHLEANKTLTATLKGAGTSAFENDLALYLLDQCPYDHSQTVSVHACLEASDSNGLDLSNPTAHPDETFTYTSTKEETVYLVVDSYWKDLNSDFDLSITVK